MILDINNLFKIKSDKQIISFIDRCKVLLPNTEKTTYVVNNTFDQHQITIPGYIKNHIHFHPEGSKKPLFRDLSFSVYSNDKVKFLPIIEAHCPSSYQDSFQIEKFVDGYELIEKDPLYYEYVGDGWKIEIYKIDKLEIFYIYYSGILSYIGFIRYGLVKRFFELKPNGKAISHLPISKSTKIKMNKNLLYYVMTSVSFPITLYIYFQSIWIVIGVVLFSWCSLAINDFINPRRHPVINIIQAIIYAIIFAFIR